jgi:hypothetical protein
MRYWPEMRILEIVYRSGRGTYRYFDVPIEEWAAFRTSSSKGTYLNEVFKLKNHRFEKVERGGRELVKSSALQVGQDQNDVPLTWGFHSE